MVPEGAEDATEIVVVEVTVLVCVVVDVAAVVIDVCVV